MSDLASYKAKSGTFVPIWTLEIQTVPEDTDQILDAVMEVHPLSFDSRRNAENLVQPESMRDRIDDSIE